jgi:hypothetical protein
MVVYKVHLVAPDMHNIILASTIITRSNYGGFCSNEKMWRSPWTTRHCCVRGTRGVHGVGDPNHKLSACEEELESCKAATDGGAFHGKSRELEEELESTMATIPLLQRTGSLWMPQKQN